MDDLILDAEASKLLVQIGRRVESWVLADAKQRAESQPDRGPGANRIKDSDIESSLRKFLDHGIVDLEELLKPDSSDSRRAG